MKKLLPILLLIFTMFAWGANFHFTKIALKYYSAIGVATWRFILGSIVLFLIIYKKYGGGLFRLRFSKKQWWYLFLTGFLGVFLTIYFFNAGLKTTSAINGALIIATSPAITAVLSYFIERRRLNLLQWVAIFISFFGVVLILIKGEFTKLLELQFETGDIYILLMALVFSSSQVIVSKYLKNIDSIVTTAISSILALGLFLVFSSKELITVDLPSAPMFWYSIIFMGVLGTAAGYASFYYCVAKIGATNSSLFMNLIPFFAVVLAFPFGEQIYIVQLVGGLIIIGGLLLFNFSNKQ